MDTLVAECAEEFHCVFLKKPESGHSGRRHRQRELDGAFRRKRNGASHASRISTERPYRIAPSARARTLFVPQGYVRLARNQQQVTVR
jgi:hypothetical protein